MPLSRADFLRAVQTLGLAPNGAFSADDVRQQYLKLMQAWHPDRNQDWEGEANSHAKSINEARDLLLQWISEGKPNWGLGGTAPRPAGDAARTRPPSDQPHAPSAPGAGGGAVKDRLFAFYWSARFIPHWRILLIPLCLVIALGVFGRGSTSYGTLGVGSLLSLGPPVPHQERISPLYWGVIAGTCLPRPRPACDPVFNLVNSRQYHVIECNYGPLHSDGTGYQDYVFWQDKVPPDPMSYAVPGDDHPFLMLGKKVVSQCPATLKGAEADFQAGRLD